MTKKTKSGKGIFILVILAALALFTLNMISFFSVKKENTLFSNKGNENSFSLKKFENKREKIKKPSRGKKYVACLHIEGTIEEENQTYNQEWILSTIDTLMKDKNNEGILLVINSPGGGVYQADEVYLKLLDYKKEGKKVWTYMESLAASGGYYIACASSSIMANRNTLTGSIGVIAGSSVDMTELLEKAGIKYTTIHSGKNKNMGNYNEVLSEEQKEILQGIADECYEQFVQIVSENRKMDLESVKKLADGRVYTARQAEKNGLIDSVLTFQEAENKILEECENNVEFIDVKYSRQEGFLSLLRGKVSLLGKSEFFSLPEAVEEKIKQKTPYPAYFYDGQF